MKYQNRLEKLERRRKTVALHHRTGVYRCATDAEFEELSAGYDGGSPSGYGVLLVPPVLSPEEWCRRY